MHIESIPQARKVAASKYTPSQATGSNTHTRSAQERTETLGRLQGSTLTEQVLVFLERYRPAYGLQ
jgi:hypothetical protein